jgi:hypothetical protein
MPGALSCCGASQEAQTSVMLSGAKNLLFSEREEKQILRRHGSSG